ncbi:MAG: hypothetical protein V7644_192 [Actinomycetota bacterium]
MRPHEAWPLAVLAAAGAVCALVADRSVDPASPAVFAAALACVAAAVAATTAAAFRRSGRSWRLVAISPVSIAAATWGVLFALRPLELYLVPASSAISLAELGFTVSDLSRSVAIAGLGITAWGAGYLAPLRVVPDARTDDVQASPPLNFSTWGAAVALACGTFLWASLFLSRGGLHVLLRSPASIRADETSSFYAFVGLWMINGVALYALAVRLRRPSAAARRLLAAAAVLALVAAVCLQVRGEIGFAAAAGVATVLSERQPTRRQVAVWLVAAGCAAALLLAMAQFRAYSTTSSTRDALTLVAKTPPSQWGVSDLSTFDNFAAVQELVPGSISYLDGRSFVWIPELLVPRTLWPGKPLGLDFLASAYLYPGVFVGIPVSLQGELYWNGGLWLVAVGGFLMGALMGLLARWGLGRARARPSFVVYAVALVYTHAYLTRSLGTMTSGLVLALVGTAIAVAASGGWSPRAPLTALRSSLPRPRAGAGDRPPTAA